ncbi:hypothetical protein ACQY0O_001211 [Thecaphora frezii]
MRFYPPSLLLVAGCLGWQACFSHAYQFPFAPPSQLPHPHSQPAPLAYHAPFPSPPTADSNHASSWSRPSRTNSSAVVWDKYSLALDGGRSRIFVFAAEFHPWRLPVPSLWRDVLQKIKAARFNTVSIYTHWGLIQPSPNPATINLSGVNDLDYFLTVANEVGLYVIVRPGPYINAETTAGGMALWTTRLNAILRTNDTAWQDAWKPYIRAVAEVVTKHQLTFGPDSDARGSGSVIMVQADNEYETGPTQRAYMQKLVDSLKMWGITVPISYNDPDRKQNFVDIVDLYGLDSYPQRFDCSHPDQWVQLRTDYLAYHEATNPHQPFMIPEFQGGSYDPYGGPGYEACERMTNARFSKVANQALIAQRVTLLSLYMVYGGTNWGGLAEPDVYTSYSYGAAILESRRLTRKYGEYKAQGHFIQSFPDLAMTEVVGAGEGQRIVEAKEMAPDGSTRSIAPETLWSTELLNPRTGSRFYVVRQHDNASEKKVRYSLEIETLGEKRVIGAIAPSRGASEPAILVDGRDSRIIPVDQQLAPGLTLRFTTANVFFSGRIGKSLFVILYGEPEDTYQWSFAADPGADIIFGGVEASRDGAGWAMAHSIDQAGAFDVTGRQGDKTSSFAKLRTNDDLEIVLGIYSTERVYQSYAPFVGSLDRLGSVEDDGGEPQHVLVSGAYLVRNATYSSTRSSLDTLHLYGSMDADHPPPIEVFTLPTIRHVHWNGEEVTFSAVDSLGGHLSLDVPGLSTEAAHYVPPVLADLEWRYADSLPEVTGKFDDSNWTKANKTSTSNPYWSLERVKTQGKVLFASEYGYHGNNIVWRGRFNGAEVVEHDGDDGEIGIEIEVQGGRGFAFSAWLNDVWLGSAETDQQRAAAKARFEVPAGALRRGESNVITVVQDHMGMNMEDGALPIGLQGDERDKHEAVKLPRGIIGYRFFDACRSRRASHVSTPSVRWKVAGNHGGELGRDTVRTPLNEGGLYAERQGWHLDGFDDSHWSRRSPWSGVERAGGIGFFRTTFDLDLPEGHDLTLAIALPPFDDDDNTPAREGGRSKSRGRYRVQLYVNGWQMGKRIANMGPQAVFPVHDGVLHHQGRNTVAISLWSLGREEEDTRLEQPPRIVVLHRSTGVARDGYVLHQPGWSELRT